MSDDDADRIMRGLTPPHWDMTAASLRDELAALLRGSLADVGSSLDKGGGDGMADLWVTVGGVEFFISIKKSAAQIRREAEQGNGT